MKKKRVDFRVVEGNKISQEIKDKILKEYIDTDKAKKDGY